MTIKTPLSRSWNEQKANLKKQFPALTDNDLQYEFGKKNKMLEKLQVKLGKSKEEWEKIMEAL
jgi:uncharacterized protein YjbJ (UPF0337 family)